MCGHIYNMPRFGWQKKGVSLLSLLFSTETGFQSVPCKNYSLRGCREPKTLPKTKELTLCSGCDWFSQFVEAFLRILPQSRRRQRRTTTSLRCLVGTWHASVIFCGSIGYFWILLVTLCSRLAERGCPLWENVVQVRCMQSKGLKLLQVNCTL